eukprot:TRINITY_DN3858_c0_g1_i6.p1 TRINITY_DN3858_c0_g1~~TRINITY_DN3858_c0_g1_i6.p1  ORF type:complete len:975 (+),score=149.99 TRINITY_DN3858_c0_g1_i6:194-3118(+)
MKGHDQQAQRKLHLKPRDKEAWRARAAERQKQRLADARTDFAHVPRVDDATVASGPRSFPPTQKPGLMPLSPPSSVALSGTSWDLPFLLPEASGFLADSYVLLPEELRWGENAIVRMCKHRRTGVKFACKSFTKSGIQIGTPAYSSLRMEVSAMTELLGHANVVALAGVFEDSCFVHVVMDYCPGGSLKSMLQRVKGFQEVEAAWLFGKIMLAVQACHEKGIVHRDLRPANVLLHTRQGVEPKLVDFHSALRLRVGQKATGLAGKPEFMAPEVICGAFYDTQADIWSLGVMLFAMLSGELPFRGTSPLKTFGAVLSGNLDFTRAPWPSISARVKLLVREMLARDPHQRPTSNHVLQHPWLLSCGTVLPSFRPTDSNGPACWGSSPLLSPSERGSSSALNGMPFVHPNALDNRTSSHAMPTLTAFHPTTRVFVNPANPMFGYSNGSSPNSEAVGLAASFTPSPLKKPLPDSYSPLARLSPSSVLSQTGSTPSGPEDPSSVSQFAGPSTPPTGALRLAGGIRSSGRTRRDSPPLRYISEVLAHDPVSRTTSWETSGQSALLQSGSTQPGYMPVPFGVVQTASMLQQPQRQQRQQQQPKQPEEPQQQHQQQAQDNQQQQLRAPEQQQQQHGQQQRHEGGQQQVPKKEEQQTFCDTGTNSGSLSLSRPFLPNADDPLATWRCPPPPPTDLPTDTWALPSSSCWSDELAEEGLCEADNLSFNIPSRCMSLEEIGTDQWQVTDTLFSDFPPASFSLKPEQTYVQTGTASSSTLSSIDQHLPSPPGARNPGCDLATSSIFSAMTTDALIRDVGRNPMANVGSPLSSVTLLANDVAPARQEENGGTLQSLGCGPCMQAEVSRDPERNDGQSSFYWSSATLGDPSVVSSDTQGEVGMAPKGENGQSALNWSGSAPLGELSVATVDAQMHSQLQGSSQTLPLVKDSPARSTVIESTEEASRQMQDLPSPFPERETSAEFWKGFM